MIAFVLSYCLRFEKLIVSSKSAIEILEKFFEGLETQSLILKPRTSIASRIEDWVSSRDCQLTFARYCSRFTSALWLPIPYITYLSNKVYFLTTYLLKLGNMFRSNSFHPESNNVLDPIKKYVYMYLISAKQDFQGRNYSATCLTVATQQTFFYKLANQDTQIWLTVTPPGKVQRASDATTNYWKHVVLHFMNKEEDILIG